MSFAKANTSPSKRIKRLIAGYEKVTAGSLVALGIGLDSMRNECPLFNHWIEALLAIPDDVE